MKKLLIVDDEENILNMLQRKLSSAGYSVIKATNGKDAISLSKNEHPDLIILDIIMPGLSGDETANIIKNDPATRDIPIIFLTTLITKDEEEKVAGNSYFIAKPFDLDRLLKEIRIHIAT